MARGGKIVLTINIKIWIAVKQSSSLISSGQHTGFLSGQAAPRRRRLLGLGLAQWGAGGGGGSQGREEAESGTRKTRRLAVSYRRWEKGRQAGPGRAGVRGRAAFLPVLLGHCCFPRGLRP